MAKIYYHKSHKELSLENYGNITWKFNLVIGGILAAIVGFLAWVTFSSPC